MNTFLIVLVEIASIAGVVYGLYGTFLEMVKNDIIFTKVESGWVKIVLSWGKYSRQLEPGFRIIGIPGIHTLYERDMKFFKTVVESNGSIKAEPYDVKKVRSFKTVQYPYALPFIDQEDFFSLNLSGIVTVIGAISDYEKAFFEISDWYAEINSVVMRVLREEVLANISFDGNISPNSGNANAGTSSSAKINFKATTTTMLSEALKKPGLVGQLSVFEYLGSVVGFTIFSVDIPAIDPPDGWRETTLAPYAARKKREAALEEARTSAALLDDTNQALAAWLESQHKLATDGKRPPVGQEEINEKKKELRDRAVLKSPQYHQEDVRISGVEGASTVIVGGGGGQGVGTGILLGNQGGGQQGGKPGGKGQGGGSGQGSGGGSGKPPTQDEWRSRGKD